MALDLSLPISKLAGVGPKFSKKLERLEIKTLENLLYHFPYRFNDFSALIKISQSRLGETATIKANVWQIKNNFTRVGFVKTTAILADTSGTIEAVWFNQSWLVNTLKPGNTFQFSGKFAEYQKKVVLVNPDFEEVGKNLHTGKLVPVYPETDGVSSKWLRTKIATLLPLIEISEFLPKKIIKKENLIALNLAISKIHFPKNYAEFEAAKARLAFDEVFKLTLPMLARKTKIKKEISFILKIDKNLISKFKKSLPFKLTSAQEKAIKEILTDLTKDYPTQRLIEGDVGCGKTVVVACAILTAIENKTRAVMAAPTEVLAFQHYKNLKNMLKKFGVKVGIFTKSRKEKNAQLLVGTHALIKNKLDTKDVSLVVVDEQHRFGVSQRTKLAQKSKLAPHLITMSATPIPRSLALTVFGDLSLTVIDEMPPGRKPARTYLVPTSKREGAFEFVKKEEAAGHQAFIVFPLIEESESLATVKAAQNEFEKLKKAEFAKIPIDLLHGRMKSADKEKALVKFTEGRTKVLVSTAVVEVGIDVPSATVMIIEGADRFGLAQLHQLRGRVGRANAQAYCFLFTNNLGKMVRQRLTALIRHADGRKLAEIDLELRGPGEFFGTAQHGFAKLKLAKLSDFKLISTTRNWAEKILTDDPNLKNYPKLERFVSEMTTKVSLN